MFTVRSVDTHGLFVCLRMRHQDGSVDPCSRIHAFMKCANLSISYKKNLNVLLYFSDTDLDIVAVTVVPRKRSLSQSPAKHELERT